jgi:hypothetical protein
LDLLVQLLVLPLFTENILNIGLDGNKGDALMTNSLQEAFKRASALPDEQQEALAAIMLEEIAAEKRWEEAFAGSQDVLEKLANEALEEHRRGETEDLDELL